MKNVRLLIVLLLIVNCTTEPSEFDERSVDAISPETQSCIDDLPKVRLTNNGTRSFEFIVYGEDYSQLHTQNISSTTDSGWIELTDNNVIIVVTNNTDYGQKIPLSLIACDNKELEIDVNNILVEL